MTEVATTNEAKLYVEQTLGAYRIFTEQGTKIWGDPTVVYEFLLEYGQEFKGYPWKKFRGRGYRMMKRNHCFENAFKMADWMGLRYCEGYAFTGVIPVHHAWCLDDDGLVVDPTWRESLIRKPQATWDYFGITFDIDRVAHFMAGKPTWSLLFDLPYNDRDNLISFVEGS